MGTLTSLMKHLGIQKMPWVIQAYLVLLMLFVFVLIVSVSKSVPQGLTREAIEALPATKLFSIASDGLKTVLGAIIGSLSLAGEATFRGRQNKSSSGDDE